MFRGVLATLLLVWIQPFLSPLKADSRLSGGFLYLDDPVKPYHLTGEWLHIKDKGDGKQPDPLSKDWKPIQVPGLWRNLGIEHYGAIYYKLDFKLSRELQNRDLGLITPNIAFAHEIYLNGKLIGSVGEIDVHGELIRRSTESTYTALPRDYITPKGTNNIIIRVGSYGSVGGFNLGNVFLGKKDTIQEKFLRSLLWDTVIVAIFIFVGFYHLVIYSARTRDKDYLYYSFLCFALALYNLSFTTLSYWIWDNFYFYYFGTVLSVNAMPILITQFFHKFFELKKRFLGKSIIVISLFLMGIGMFLNLTGEDNFYRFNSFVLKWILATLAISILYPIYLIWIGIQRDKVGRYLVLVGYSLFVASAINDIFVYLNLYNFYKFVELGFFAFIICISFAMAMKFAQVHTDLEYLTDNLKDEVTRRTRELTETNKRLIEMDKMKTSFFANVTHELRTPITLSLLPIEQLIQTSENAHDLNLLETAHRNNIKLLKLINDLLDFAKLEAGLMSLRLMPTNITTMILGILAPFEINAKERNILIHKDILNDCISSVDPEKLEKIITNLLSNAYKFTEDGGKIWVHLSLISQNEEYVKILIGNDGAGIPEEELDHVFERFRQVDMSTQRRFEGTGIGLSLVKELTELHGGYVEVDSALGVKTEFSIFLPTKRTDSSNDNQSSDSPEIQSTIQDPSDLSVRWMDSISITTPSTQPNLVNALLPNVLIVEDNREMVYLLNDLLKDSYNLSIANNPKLGLELAIQSQPDLILSDVMMPEMNGFQLTKELRSHKNTKNTPIVLLTAMNDLDGKLEGFTQGVDDYISKPFQPLELKARISSLIQKSQLQKEKNIRLSQLQKELILARDIQSMLLPREIPELAEFSIQSLYIPLDEVGGDFYDIHMDNGLVTIFMADVSGHGVPACLIACMVKMAFQSEVRHTKNKTISDIMRGVNKSLYKIIGNNFVTACIARINLETKEFRYITAGHPPIFHISKGKAHPLQTKGRPLGLFEDFDLPYESFYLNAQDSLFFYTDGIIECSNESGELYEEDRLIQFLERSSNLEPEDVIESLTQELRGYSGSNQLEDDLTALHIKFSI